MTGPETPEPSELEVFFGGYGFSCAPGETPLQMAHRAMTYSVIRPLPEPEPKPADDRNRATRAVQMGDGLWGTVPDRTWQASLEVDPQRLADHQSQAEAEKVRTFPVAPGDGPWVTDDQGLHWHLEERDRRLVDHFRERSDALSPNARVRLAELFQDAVSELEDDVTVAVLACEGLGGEERHPHTFEALQDLCRALRRFSHEAGLSVAEVQAEAEVEVEETQTQEPEEPEHE